MTVDEIVKLMLAITFSLSILGISIQLMRVLGTFNAILQDARFLAYKFAELVESIQADYKKIANSVSEFTAPIAAVKTGFIDPVSNLLSIVGTAADVLNGKITGRKQ